MAITPDVLVALEALREKFKAVKKPKIRTLTVTAKKERYLLIIGK